MLESSAAARKEAAVCPETKMRREQKGTLYPGVLRIRVFKSGNGRERKNRADNSKVKTFAKSSAKTLLLEEDGRRVG
jgi:hypothetical protein